MRAIENRIGVARAANTGISQLVDPLGRVEDSTGLFTDAVVTGDVKTSGAMTLYTRFGDVLGWGAAITALLAAVLSAYRRADGSA
jgi:apolipoprotein N-acyltransferase